MRGRPAFTWNSPPSSVPGCRDAVREPRSGKNRRKHVLGECKGLRVGSGWKNARVNGAIALRENRLIGPTLPSSSLDRFQYTRVVVARGQWAGGGENSEEFSFISREMRFPAGMTYARTRLNFARNGRSSQLPTCIGLQIFPRLPPLFSRRRSAILKFQLSRRSQQNFTFTRFFSHISLDGFFYNFLRNNMKTAVVNNRLRFDNKLGF